MSKALWAAILAGGGSKRFGQNKAILKFNSLSLIQRIFMQARLAFADVRIIAEPMDMVTIPKDRFIPDKINGIGPLGGILTALEFSKRPCLVLTCDTPFIMAEHIKYLARRFSNDHHATVAVSKSGIEPLFAVYKPETLPIIKEQVAAKNFAVYHFIQKISVKYVDFRDLSFKEQLFFNINTLSDYKKAVNLDPDEIFKKSH